MTYLPGPARFLRRPQLLTGLSHLTRTTVARVDRFRMSPALLVRVKGGLLRQQDLVLVRAPVSAHPLKQVMNLVQQEISRWYRSMFQ
jgi:hypothetical protein